MAIVPVVVGVADDSIPTGPQISAKYTLISPSGARVVFNDQNDRDMVGVMTDISGIDSPDVRESADDLVQLDGGVHGEFFYGRRPITLSGILLNPVSADDRNRRMTKLMAASNAMRQDGTLSWVLQNGYEQFVKVRRNSALRITGKWQKEFQVALVAADPRIYGATLQSGRVNGTSISTGHIYASNAGNAPMFPQIVIQGPVTNPVLKNSNGGSISLTYTLTSTDRLVIDTLNRTVTDQNGLSRYSAVDFLSTTWWSVDPGVNDITFSASSATGSSWFMAYWRDAWI